MRKVLSGLLMTSLVVWVLTDCALLEQNIQQPKVAFESFHLGDVSLESITLVTAVAITNPNKFPIPLKRIYYSLTINDRLIFDGKSSTIDKIEPGKPQTAELPVNLSSESLDFFVNSLLQDKQINYIVNGSVKISGFDIPFNVNDTIFLPEIKIGSLRFSTKNLNKIVAILPLEIVNSNNFELPFKGLEYTVNGNGQSLFANQIEQDDIAKGTTSLEIPFEIDPSVLFISSLQFLKNPNIDLGINAIADFGFTKLPINQQRPIKLN